MKNIDVRVGGSQMKLQNWAVAAIVALMVPLMGASPSWAETDPFPGVAYGQEIPGTRISSAVGESWASFNASAAVAAHSCATGSGNAIESNVGARIRSYYCIKTWQTTSTTDAWADYRETLAAAQAAAGEESQAWNEANPGKQKCVQWGPITDPNGGVSSGGVCANVVPIADDSEEQDEVPAESVGEGDESSESDSDDANSSLSEAPLPGLAASIRGSGYPFTVIIEGQVGLSECPSPYNAANGLIAAIGEGTFTECWPAAAWAAYRIGGDTWQMFKATDGTYDINAVIDNRKKVELLKAKAKEVAEAAALKTPGIDRCSSWSGYGESGKECAYAFIDPKGKAGLDNSSEADEPSDADEPSSVEDSEDKSSISVGLDSTEVKGSSLVIAQRAIAITPDKVEAASISDLAKGFTEVDTIQRSLFQWFPRDRELNYKVESLTPNVCLASSWRVRITNSGLCQVEILITDSEGNEYELIKKMRRYF